MLCPECGSKTSVVRPASFTGLTMRVCECPCGVRFETEERITRRLPVATGSNGSQRVATGGGRLRRVTPGPNGPQPLATGSGGGVGGALSSGSDPESGSQSDPLSDPDLPPKGDQEVDPARVESDPLRSAPGILSAFRVRWEKAERKIFVKGRFDEREAHDLAESINEIPDPDRRAAAWAEIKPAMDRFMRTSKPFYAGHPFSAFIKDLAALRSDVPSAQTPNGAPAPFYAPIKPLPPGVPRPRP